MKITEFKQIINNIIKEELIRELEFNTKEEYNKYRKIHHIRPDTIVKIDGKNTTAREADSDNSSKEKQKSKSTPEKSKEIRRMEDFYWIKGFKVISVPREGHLKYLQSHYKDFDFKSRPKITEENKDKLYKMAGDAGWIRLGDYGTWIGIGTLPKDKIKRFIGHWAEDMIINNKIIKGKNDKISLGLQKSNGDIDYYWSGKVVDLL